MDADAALKAVTEVEDARDNTFSPDKEAVLLARCNAVLALVPEDIGGVDGAVNRARLLSFRGRALCAASGGRCTEGSDAAARAKQGEALLTKAVKMNPRCSDSWAALGHLYWGQGRLAQAKEAYGSALDAEPAHIRALQDSALVLRSLRTGEDGGRGHIELAVERSKAALAADFASAQSWYTHGMVNLTKYFALTFDQADLKAALKAFDLADKYNSRGHPDIHMNRGQCQKYVLQWDAAAASLSAAVAADPSFDEAKESLADLRTLFANAARKWGGYAGFNEKALVKQVKGLPAAGKGRTVRGKSLDVLGLDALTKEEGAVTTSEAVVLKVLESIDGSTMPLLYLAVGMTHATPLSHFFLGLI